MSRPPAPPAEGAAAPRPRLGPIRMALAGLAAVLLLALMGVTVVDVAGRYLFNSPIFGATELTELILAAVIFCGLPAVCLDDGHVTVRLLTARLGARGRRIELAVARVLTAAALGVVAWRLAVQGMRTASYGEVTTYLRLPVGPIAYTAAALCALAAVLTLALVVLRAERGGTGASV
ncbi:TRAP transporter small permease [Acuticoccus sp. I52.16.1]|uniref:TRAP transporter small permease n=1 Tax=Acuticoccus sp. I52.16.1 TaxID=2928472 RepID=UPI001FD201CA|nr:TRAP transporter small permease [Acuticoccus sp. I52.16.1]UOM33996.1 TRAP transporter small permease [Acuticoccus sp. I52.16.1]